jgi:predicted DNA-binding transcriptional regulator AlpA
MIIQSNQLDKEPRKSRKLENVAPTGSKVLRLKQAAHYCGFSTTTLWRLEQTDPDFPRKIKFSARVCGYRMTDLDAYLAKKAEVAI